MHTSAVTVRPVAGGEMADWEVSDELWARIKPLLPVVQRRSRYPGRRRLDDRACLNGILFVLVTGMCWDRLPPQLGYGSYVRDWIGCTMPMAGPMLEGAPVDHPISRLG